MTAATGELRNRPAYRDRDVTRWLLGLAFSLLGDQVYFVALAWVAARSASPGDVGAILGAGSVPRLLLLLFGGAAADRFGPKRTALISDALRAGVMVLVAAVLGAGAPSVTLLVTLAVVFGVVDALYLPAVGALPRRLVTEDELARLQGMKAVVERLSIVLGAPLAGWLVAGYGLAAAFAANAVLFSLSVAILAVTRLRPREEITLDGDPSSDSSCPAPATGLLADVAAGLRYVRSSRLLQVLLLVVAVVEVGFSGPINVGLPLLALDQGWGATGVGLVLGGFGAGAALTSLGVAVLGHVPHAGAVAGASALLLGGMVTGVGLSPTLAWAVAASTALGAASGVCGTLFSALVLHAAGADQAGRVMALLSVAALGTMPLGYAGTGMLAGLSSPAVPFVLGGAATALAAAVCLLLPSTRAAVLPRAERSRRPETLEEG
jgi:hypothetical protein